MIIALLVILTVATLVYFSFLAKAIKTIETKKETDLELRNNDSENDIMSIIKTHGERFDKIEESISLLLLKNALEEKDFSFRKSSANYKWHLYSNYLTEAFKTEEVSKVLNWEKTVEENKKVEEDIEVTPSFDNRDTYQLY